MSFLPFQPHDRGGPRIREIPLRMVLPNLVTVLAICAGLSGIWRSKAGSRRQW